MSKSYQVTFTETYTYTKTITVEDNEDITEVIRDPLQCPTVRDMSNEQFSESDISVCNDYEVKDNN